MFQGQINSTAVLVSLILLLMFTIVLAYWSAISYANEPVPTSRPRYTGPPPDGKGTLLISYSYDIPYFVEPWWRDMYGTSPVRGRREGKKAETHQSSEED